ncbi:MAG: YfiR family protein [Planctomycetota bacterium]
MGISSLIVLFLLLVVLSTSGPVQADYGDDDTHDTHHREYEVKAAFIYNFMNFIDRPQDKGTKKQDSGKTQEPIIIGTVGICSDGHNLNEVFGHLTEKKFKNRSIVVKHFPGFEQYRQKIRSKAKYKDKYKAEYSKAMKDCHVLFVASSEAEHVKEIMVLVKGGNVLTVGETEGFCASGGIIKFVTEDQKIRFEINLAAAKRAKLEIRSKLLRLSRKIIKKDDEDADKTKP